MTRYTVSSFGISRDDIVTGQMTSARSPTGHARAHGYARLQEERSPRLGLGFGLGFGLGLP